MKSTIQEEDYDRASQEYIGRSLLNLNVEEDDKEKEVEEFLKSTATESQSNQRRKRRASKNDNGESNSTLELRHFVERMIEVEFSTKDQIPKSPNLINIGNCELNSSRYKPGDWVEVEGDNMIVEGNDMTWGLNMITRVIRQAPDDWDWNAPENEGKEPMWTFKYKVGDYRDIDETQMRSPEEGLRAVFGSRPWVWQQWAILKVEQKLRFQEGHQDDFLGRDIQKLAAGE